MNDMAAFDLPAAPKQETRHRVRLVARERVRRAVADLVDGVGRWWIWTSMGGQDIRQRYRGSMLGPFWLTISMAVMIGTLGFLYSTLFKLDVRSYMPYLTLGLLFWTFIATILTEGCATFLAAEPLIQQIKMPFTVH